MHIAEGILSGPVLAVGGVVTAAGVGAGLWRMPEDRVPTVAVMSSAFFVLSLVHVPIGPSSAHLLLTGVMGLVLGLSAFPALLVALFLQAAMFGFGGLSTLGVNTMNMALPAVLCYWSMGGVLRRAGPAGALAIGIAAGVFAIALTCLLAALALYCSGKEFGAAAAALVVAHVPVMVVEGLMTGAVVAFLRQVRPEVLDPCFGAQPREDPGE